MQINIIVDNDKCWNLNTVRRIIPLLTQNNYRINHIWILPEKLSKFYGFSISIWYLRIFGFLNFSKLVFFYLTVLLINFTKKNFSFRSLAVKNNIECTYINSLNSK